MAIQQPSSGDNLNSPDHSLSHRVFANDDSAPAQSVTVDAGGSTLTKGRKMAIATKTDTYTATVNDEIIICNKAAAMTINLPAASGSGLRLDIKNINTGTVTVDGNSSDTIDGETTQDLIQYENLTIVDYAANAWAVL